MSIDGPGILASDFAHDVYNQVMDWWDADVSFDEICERLRDYGDTAREPVDAEIFLAARVKAFWQIGQLPAALREALRAMVDEGTSLAAWADGGDAALARQRKAALERLLAQTATPKARPRPRRKYPQVRERLHAVGDCLELAADGKTHRGVVCRIRQYRGQCEYAVLVMHPETGSTRESFEAGRYYGNAIRTPDGVLAGPHVIRLEHRLLVRAGNPFKTIAHVDIDESRLMYGSFGGVLDMHDVIEDFERTIDIGCSAFRMQLAPLAGLLVPGAKADV